MKNVISEVSGQPRHKVSSRAFGCFAPPIWNNAQKHLINDVWLRVWLALTVNVSACIIDRTYTVGVIL